MGDMLKPLFDRSRRGRFALAGVVIAISVGGLGEPAKAGDKKATAKMHYETGTRLYEIGEYDKALLEYKSAYLALPDPAFLFNIGQCHRKLGQSAEALKFFQRYLKKASPGDPSRRQIEARIRDIEAESKAAPPSPVSIPAPDAKEGAAQAAPAPSIPNPAADHPAPPAAPALPPAAESVEQAAPVSAAPPAGGRGLRIAGIACGAAGLASIGTAIYFYTRATSFSDRVSNSPEHTTSDEQAGKNAETMQWVFYGLGAGALATGTVLYLLGWRSADAGRAAVGVTPLVGPGVAGVSAQGTF